MCFNFILAQLSLDRNAILSFCQANQRNYEILVEWFPKKINKKLNNDNIIQIKQKVYSCLSQTYKKYLPKYNNKLWRFKQAHSK